MGRRWAGPAVALAIGVTAGCGHKEQIEVADGRLISDQGVLDFGPVELHGQAVRHLKVTNVGMAEIQVVGVGSIGQDPDQFHGSTDPGLALASGQSSTVDVVFSPTRAGPLIAKLSIQGVGAATQTLEVPLQGLGVDARITLNPSQLDFGKVEVGATAVQLIVAENSTVLPTRAVLAPKGPDAADLTIEPEVLDLANGATSAISVLWTPSHERPLSAWIEAIPCPWCVSERIDLTGTAIPYELIAVPGSVNFGLIPKDFSVERTIALENVSDHSLSVLGIGLAPGSSGDFAVDAPGPLPAVIAAGGALQVKVRFLTSSLQPANGLVAVTSTDPGHPQLNVPLAGGVGGALIAVAPSVVDFGVVPLGARPIFDLVIENQGTGATLTVTGASLTGASQFAIDASQLPATLGPQQKIDLPIAFEPTGTGQLSAQISVQSNDPLYPTETVAVLGRARTTQPCVLRMDPPAVDFGSIPQGGGAVLAFHATDIGTDVCIFRHIEIDPTSQPGFLLPGGDVDSFVINPGEFAQAQVAFQGRQPGSATGAVSFTVNDPQDPDRRLPLTARADQPCLSASPAWLDYGPVTPGCGSGLDLSTQIQNGCNHTVMVNRISVGAGTTKDFTVKGAPGVPLAVPPGGLFNVQVHYAAVDIGMQAAPLFVESDDVPRPILVPLLSDRLDSNGQVDDFRQQSGQRSDVLFIMANTGSMRTKLSAVLAAVPDFTDALGATGLDYHVGVTTTGLQPGPDALWQCPGGAQGGEDGRLFPVDGSSPRILDRSISDLTSALGANLQVGFCHYYEQGLEAMRLSLTPPLSTSAKAPGTPQPNDGNLGFLRDGASLAVVVVSDDNDYSGLPESNYLQTLKALSGWGKDRRVTVSSVVDVSGCPQDTTVGQRYLDVTHASAGLAEDLCAADLGPAFKALATQVTGLQGRFPLSQAPQPATIQVTVNGSPVSDWSYDPTSNSVVFPSGGEPPADSQVEVTYQALCQ